MFGKPIDKRLLIEVDFTMFDAKRNGCLDCVAPFMKEGFAKGVQEELRDRQDATSRYLLSALILNNDSVMGAIRRELRRVVDVLVDDDEILKVLRDEVIKRETVDGPQADAAVRRINRKESRSLRAKSSGQPPFDCDEKVLKDIDSGDTKIC